VIASDIPALREALSPLSRDGAVFLRPDAPEAWTDALARAEGSAGAWPRRPSIDERRRLLETYSIENLGLAMDRIYRRVLELPL
jgi:hypothetical protein